MTNFWTASADLQNSSSSWRRSSIYLLSQSATVRRGVVVCSSRPYRTSPLLQRRDLRLPGNSTWRASRNHLSAVLRRLSQQKCRRWMLTGEAFDGDTAIREGFVDAASFYDKEAAEVELEKMLDALCATPIATLRARKRVMEASLLLARPDGGTGGSEKCCDQVGLLGSEWGSLGVAASEAGHLSLSAPTSSDDPINTEGEVASPLVHLTWPELGLADIELLEVEKENDVPNEDRTRALISALKEILDNLKCMGNEVRAVIIRGCFDFGSDPEKWIANELSSISITGVERATAIVHEIVHVSTTLSDISAPVLAVLGGPVSGVGLAIALAADWRVGTSDAVLDYSATIDQRLDTLLGLRAGFGQIMGSSVRNASGHASGEFLDGSSSSSTGDEGIASGCSIDAELASSLSLITAPVYNSISTAVDAAVALAKTVVAAPAAGARNTISFFGRVRIVT